jgi:hypothetical protein
MEQIIAIGGRMRGLSGNTMRYVGFILALGLASATAGCSAVPDARPISLDSAEAERVRSALVNRPAPTNDEGLRLALMARFRIGGVQRTAPGFLEYHGPRDFRVTVASESGAVLFDGRVNWAGVTILRHRPEFEVQSLEALFADLARAFEPPMTLDGLEAGAQRMVLTRRMGDTYRYTWIFDRADGDLVNAEVELDVFDTLRIDYGRHLPGGWPAELHLARGAKEYDVNLAFAPMPLAQSPGDGGK